MILVAGLGIASAEAATINFDTDASDNPINALDLFVNTTRLADLYAPLGVDFSGSGGNDGGVILNQSGNFDIDARSGLNFLVFNRDARLSDGGVPTDPETITFNTLLNSVSIFAASANDTATFTLEAFDRNNLLVGSNTITTQPSTYSQLSVSSASGNISRIVLTSRDDNYFVYDDLSFTPVPEPSSVLGTLTFGVLGTSYMLKHKLKKQKSVSTIRNSQFAIRN
ncbi:hypothetical protein [Nostoc sp. ChiQUE01b]|uniref:hypothetical protein n=1 Tax=Nostoc sp. ChiQUE01b TaxID=3075376 RepID=UPI002AD431D0|nr:hypothetical protein [Nostoc sp. ChiQUE01b]